MTMEAIGIAVGQPIRIRSPTACEGCFPSFPKADEAIVKLLCCSPHSSLAEFDSAVLPWTPNMANAFRASSGVWRFAAAIFELRFYLSYLCSSLHTPIQLQILFASFVT